MPDIIDLSRRAWDAARTEHQPLYDNLVNSYRDMLHARAEAVNATKDTSHEGGIFERFEQNALEELIPERFHVQSAPDAISHVDDVQPYRVDDEPALDATPPKPKAKVVKKGKK